MIKLPQVTLIAITGLGYKIQEHLEALKRSSWDIEFGEVKLIQLGSIVDIDSWNKAIIYDLPRYITTDFCMLIHHDGYIIQPDLWNQNWLDYDYIGAPWPLPQDNFSYRDSLGNLVRVGNSISLRSKKLMDLVATREWKSYYGFFNEDGFICCHHRNWLEEQACKFAPLDVAIHFSKEHEIPENKDIKTFAFHQI